MEDSSGALIIVLTTISDLVPTKPTNSVDNFWLVPTKSAIIYFVVVSFSDTFSVVHALSVIR